MSKSRRINGVAATLLAAAMLVVPPELASASGVAAHIEGGIGNSRVPSIEVPSVFSATFGAGIGFPAWPGRLGLEFSASSGDQPFFEIGIPEAATSGKRSLTTFLLGAEWVDAKRARGPFASIGVGMGHATLTGATGGSQYFNQPGWAYPDREYVGAAFGAGVGWRSEGGPRPTGFPGRASIPRRRARRRSDVDGLRVHARARVLVIRPGFSTIRLSRSRTDSAPGRASDRLTVESSLGTSSASSC